MRQKYSPTFENSQLDIVGSTHFGRYPKISVEQTYNMIISDGWMVPYAGYKNVTPTTPVPGEFFGRAIYTSNINNIVVIVIGNQILIGQEDFFGNFYVQPFATIATEEGPVYITEGIVTIPTLPAQPYNQIVISDLQNLYVIQYTISSPGFVFQTLTPAMLGFSPGYITYQDTRFIATINGTSQWILSAANNATDWNISDPVIGTIQTKPDTTQAVVRFPGRGNVLLVFGTNVTEIWTDIGQILFPYQRQSSQNIDYGCLNPQTIAYNTNMVVWLGANEQSGPFILFTTGGDPQKISTDGIDFQLAQLTNPSNAYGFLFRQDGHDLYQITFPDDRLTYVYDFNTQMFFTLSDENLSYHIAKRVCFYKNNYYFVSINDNNVYEFGTQYTNFYYAADNIQEIPRIRVTKNFRLPDNSRFTINNLAFTMEQGTGFLEGPALNNNNPLISSPPPQVIVLSISKNGGESFGSGYVKTLNTEGNYINKVIFWRMGAANDFVFQFRFAGFGRFLATSGTVSAYQ